MYLRVSYGGNHMENEELQRIDSEYMKLFWYFVSFNHEFLSKPFLRIFKNHYDLNNTQVAVLTYSRLGDYTMGELSIKLDISKQHASQLIRNLESKGLIQRETNPLNRREVFVKRTTKATQIIEEGKQIYLDWAKEKLKQLDDGELHQMQECMQYLNKIIPRL